MDEHIEIYYSSLKLLPWMKKYNIISKELMNTLLENLKLFESPSMPFESYCYLPLIIQIIIENSMLGKDIKNDAVKLYEVSNIRINFSLKIRKGRDFRFSHFLFA